ncbi:hypothetical protein sscle_12g086970 [Sclerotinia sclerotiorum 1980 UF-70]|uniref:Uncharacterized protein n=1 Tax=Sclerotinia sclerotiorum (strain ATCC 18683 / 1980 / Ss-1) TaxID=665079 RepID=A0A1D9QG56_SCLS1|nr:hypothetical protein sscle_12g086970 [Sclerotinia sclerotiorum 1980 UF-70]
MRPIDNNLVDPQHSWKPRLTINITNKDSPFQKSYQAVTVDKDENIGLHDLLLGFRKCYEGVFAYELLVSILNESRKGDQVHDWNQGYDSLRIQMRKAVTNFITMCGVKRVCACADE